MNDLPRSTVTSGVERLERTGLPGEDLVGDLVGDLRDRLMAQLGADHRGEVVLDVADDHPV